MLSAELVTELGASHSVALFWASQWLGVLNLSTSHQLVEALVMAGLLGISGPEPKRCQKLPCVHS